MSVNIWDNSYEEKAQLNKCDLSATSSIQAWCPFWKLPL